MRAKFILFGLISLSLLTCRTIPLEEDLFDFEIEVISPIPKNILVGDSVKLVVQVHTNKPLDLPEVLFRLGYTSSLKAELYGQNKIGILSQNNNIITNLDSFVIYYFPREKGEHTLTLSVTTNFNSKVSRSTFTMKSDILLYDANYENERGGYDPLPKINSGNNNNPTNPADKVGTNNSQIFSPYLGKEKGDTGAFVNESIPVSIYLKPSKDPYSITFNNNIVNNVNVNPNIAISIANDKNENSNNLIPKNQEYALKNQQRQDFTGGWVKFFVKITDFLAQEKDPSGNGVYQLPVTIHHNNESYPTTVNIRQTSEPIDLVITSIVDTTEQEVFTGKNRVNMHEHKVLKITLENRTKSNNTKTYVAFKNHKMDVINNDYVDGYRGVKMDGAFYFELEPSRKTFDFYLSANSLGQDTLNVYAYNDREITRDKEKLVLQQLYNIVSYSPAQLSRSKIFPTSVRVPKTTSKCSSLSTAERVVYDVRLKNLSFGQAVANSTKKINVYIGSTSILSNFPISELSSLSLVNFDEKDPIYLVGQEIDLTACGGTYPQLDVKSLITVRDKYGNDLVVTP